MPIILPFNKVLSVPSITGPGLDAYLLHSILPHLPALTGCEGYPGASSVSQVSFNLKLSAFPLLGSIRITSSASWLSFPSAPYCTPLLLSARQSFVWHVSVEGVCRPDLLDRCLGFLVFIFFFNCWLAYINTTFYQLMMTLCKYKCFVLTRYGIGVGSVMVLCCFCMHRFIESNWFVWITQMNHIPMHIDYDKNVDWFSTQVRAPLQRAVSLNEGRCITPKRADHSSDGNREENISSLSSLCEVTCAKKGDAEVGWRLWTQTTDSVKEKNQRCYNDLQRDIFPCIKGYTLCSVSLKLWRHYIV